MYCGMSGKPTQLISSGSRLLPATTLPPRGSATALMAQKSIDTFFTNVTTARKRAKRLDGSAADVQEQVAVATANSTPPELVAPVANKPVPAVVQDTTKPQLVSQPAVAATHSSPEQLQAKASRAYQVAADTSRQAAGVSTTPRHLQDLLVEGSWRRALSPEFHKPYYVQLEKFLQTEWKTQQVFPPQPMVFRALNSCPLPDVRVVILGQDPYHNDNQAMGLSFSVPPGQAVPSSLQNIYKELKADIPGFQIPKHGSLEKWTSQGVLLLNASLTVRAHLPNSHARKGWEPFTESVIRAVSNQRQGVIFLLWGRFAQQKAKLINRGKHHVLEAAHPSGLSANRGFFGCKHFSKTNALLQQQGLPPVDWQIDNA